MKKDYLVAGAVVAGAIALDQLSKWLIRLTMELGDSVQVIRSFFHITRHHNEGAAWGIFPGQMTFFIVITIIAVGLFAFLSKELDFKRKTFFSIGISLLFGGAIGNFIDRLRFRYVVDFLDFRFFGYSFPIFNVADICLTVGIALFAFELLYLEPRRAKSDET